DIIFQTKRRALKAKHGLGSPLSSSKKPLGFMTARTASFRATQPVDIFLTAERQYSRSVARLAIDTGRYFRALFADGIQAVHSLPTAVHGRQQKWLSK
ncbi:hypothetical protein, partial [Salinicola salarius]|uniref:hypothetical protein n=1 Tax=Salinicola salarius TaxID=430457 RepID=UPI001C4E9A93